MKTPRFSVGSVFMACFCVAAVLAPIINRFQFVAEIKNERQDYLATTSKEKFNDRVYLVKHRLHADDMNGLTDELKVSREIDSVEFLLEIDLDEDLHTDLSEFEFRKRTIDALQPLLALNEWGGVIHWQVKVQSLSRERLQIAATSWQGTPIRE